MKANLYALSIFVSIVVSGTPQISIAQDHDAPTGWTSARPDSHAPIGVMGDHTHGKGEFMASYRYMTMGMKGNLDGTDSISDQEVFDGGFMVSPTKMTMGMHMFGLMYAPSDIITMALMIPFSTMSMDHITRMGATFSTKTDGLSDVKLSGLVRVARFSRQQIHLNVGVSFPTGSIDERGDTPMGDDVKLPYPMQLGSGTFDFLPGVTYLGESDKFSWGAQANGTVRTGENNLNYKLGSRAGFTAWGAGMWTRGFSTSLRVDAQTWKNIKGADEDLNPMVVPTADPSRRGGDRVDVLVGVNLYARSGFIKGQRLAVEAGMPVYQSLDGPQLQTDFTLTVGWQYAW